MGNGGNGECFLRQLSAGGSGDQGWGYTSYYSSTNSGKGSRRWGKVKNGGGGGGGWEQREEEGGGGESGWYNDNAAAAVAVAKKRVMVVIDDSAGAKHAMIWALTHVANKGDLLTLLHVLPPPHRRSAPAQRSNDTPQLANSLGTLCKACNPEVEVEALVIQGPKLATVLSQVRKLEASVLVLSQSKPSPLCCLFRSKSEEFVEQCINRADCLTLAVRRQSKGVGGYLVSTRWQKNFWLLA